MLTALNDLENGKPVPWLSARKRRGASLTADAAVLLRGRCAGVVEFLMKAGKSLEDAAES